MSFDDRTKEVLKRLEKITKDLPHEEFNYEILSGAINNDEFDILIEHFENQIKLVNKHPDSKKRFQIMEEFFNKLENDNLYDSYEIIKSKNGFYDAKKVMQGSKIHAERFKKPKNLEFSDENIDSLCKIYAHAYERACRLYFKPLAEAITKKKIQACGDCINRILEYYPEINFVLEPFVPHIRNSIDHVDYYPKSDKKLIVFEDRDKPAIEITVEQLDTICMLQVASDLSISTADHARKMPLYKTCQYYFKKTEEYCKILGIDFGKITIAWVSKGRNILGLHNALEKLIKG